MNTFNSYADLAATSPDWNWKEPTFKTRSVIYDARDAGELGYNVYKARFEIKFGDFNNGTGYLIDLKLIELVKDDEDDIVEDKETVEAALKTELANCESVYWKFIKGSEDV
jgi:hypothetical protein